MKQPDATQERPPGIYWIATARAEGNGTNEAPYVFAWDVEAAFWDGSGGWITVSGPDYSVTDDNEVRVLCGPLEPPAAPPAEPMPEPYLTRCRWYNVFSRELRKDPNQPYPDQKRAAAVADREVPEYASMQDNWSELTRSK